MRMTIRNREFMTTDEAAKVLGKTDRMVRYDLEAGRLAGAKILDSWLIPRRSVTRALRGGKKPVKVA